MDFEMCDELIEIFNTNLEAHEKIRNDKKPNFTQFNLTNFLKLDSGDNDIHDKLVNLILLYKEKYYKFIDHRVFPQEFLLENLKIKKYFDKNDEFDTHVDVADYATARRFLSFMFYLNDVDDGGETKFSSLSIKPEKGKLVIFPPLWMFPHRGEPPLKGSKYIMSTYLHYK